MKSFKRVIGIDISTEGLDIADSNAKIAHEHDVKMEVVVANPARIKDFAKGHGFLEKSYKIDARVLQLYGQQVKVSLAKPRTLQERNFIALTRRRTQLLQIISQESNRLRQSNDTQVIAFPEKIPKSL